MNSFPVVQAHQQFGREVANACDAIERGITRGIVVGFVIGVGFGCVLLAIIAVLTGPLP